MKFIKKALAFALLGVLMLQSLVVTAFAAQANEKTKCRRESLIYERASRILTAIPKALL